MAGLSVEPTAGPAGAYIRGVDLTGPLNVETVAKIRSAWLDHQVLAFPDQPLDDAALERFTGYFGAFGDDPFIEALPDHPHVLELRREPDEKVTNFGAGWHSDWSFQEYPPSATILHSRVIPPVGGDTLFASGYAAYDALSRDMKARLEGLLGVHSARRPYSTKGIYAQDAEKRAMKFKLSDAALAEERHPIVRTHPETGRKTLYVNMVYTVGIDGMDQEEASDLLEFLFRHTTEPRFVYRHKWQPGMLIMWDNRCLQHFAEGGYDGHLRVMHRTTVKGDRPF